MLQITPPDFPPGTDPTLMHVSDDPRQRRILEDAALMETTLHAAEEDMRSTMPSDASPAALTFPPLKRTRQDPPPPLPLPPPPPPPTTTTTSAGAESLPTNDLCETEDSYDSDDWAESSEVGNNNELELKKPPPAPAV